VEFDDEETVVETRPVVLSVPSVPVKPKVESAYFGMGHGLVLQTCGNMQLPLL
jgi:hypothetical protein